MSKLFEKYNIPKKYHPIDSGVTARKVRKTKFSKKEIGKWLADRYITNYTINDDLTVDLLGQSTNYLYGFDFVNYKPGEKFPIQFNESFGDFLCHGDPGGEGRRGLTSLIGSPRIVHGRFSCAMNQLTSLEGSPEIVKGDFDCYENPLTSLIGCPKIVKGDFDCRKTELDSLDYLPEIHGELVCDDYLKEGPVYEKYLKQKREIADCCWGCDLCDDMKNI